MLSAASENKNESTFDLVIDLAKKLLNKKDFEKALKSVGANWLDSSLRHFSQDAGPKTFEMIWQFFKENLDKSELRTILLKRDDKGENFLSTLAKTQNKPTASFIFNLMRELFDRSDFAGALESGSQNWLTDAFCEFASEAELENFELFWNFCKTTSTTRMIRSCYCCGKARNM